MPGNRKIGTLHHLCSFFNELTHDSQPFFFKFSMELSTILNFQIILRIQESTSLKVSRACRTWTENIGMSIVHFMCMMHLLEWLDIGLFLCLDHFFPCHYCKTGSHCVCLITSLQTLLPQKRNRCYASLGTSN